MKELSTLTHADFAPLQDDTWAALLPDGSRLPLALIEIQQLGGPPAAGGPLTRQAFSLLWRGPLQPWIGQGTYHLSHPELDELVVFVVALGPMPDGSGMRYEAIFT
jgi:hypothetical protein